MPRMLTYQTVAFPSIYEIFGSNASAKAMEITTSLDEWAQSQAHNTGAGPDELRRMLEIQARIIVNDHGKQMYRAS